MDARKSAIFVFQFIKPTLQTIMQLIRSWNTIHSFRDSVLVCKMHGCMIRKIFKRYGISIPTYQAMQVFAMNRLDENKPLQNAFNKHVHCQKVFRNKTFHAFKQTRFWVSITAKTPKLWVSIFFQIVQNLMQIEKMQ